MSKAKMFLIVFCVTVFLLTLTNTDFGYFHHTTGEYLKTDEYFKTLSMVFAALNAMLILHISKLAMLLSYLQRRNLYRSSKLYAN